MKNIIKNGKPNSFDEIAKVRIDKSGEFKYL